MKPDDGLLELLVDQRLSHQEVPYGFVGLATKGEILLTDRRGIRQGLPH